ncbi:MAG: HEAT repeat domain-containing protein [Kofleriaceae bacterium]|nr:HEAT repeat domain-containing protein [Kofleriaceae bacterium]
MRRSYSLLAATFAVTLGASGAAAQPVDVGAQIKMIESQPSDMDRAAWKEKRREAARKLVQSKDKKAIPVLIKLADTETFDIIGEIAIEGLGNLGDQSAVPVLQKVANDQTRDKATRDLAKKALFKLGANATGGGSPTTTTPPPTTTTPPVNTTTTTPPAETSGETGGGATGGGGEAPGTDLGSPGSSLLGGGTKASTELPDLPVLPDDALAAYDRLTFAAGAASLEYDTVRKRPSFEGDFSASYLKRIEREKMAWGWGANTQVVAGFISPEGREQTRGVQFQLDAHGEARFYQGKIYGVGRGAAGFQTDYISYKDGDDPANDLKDNRFTADVQVALGVGYGRVLDVGGAIRVRRLARVLDAARALGKQIDAATARKLQLTWWALRGERSAYRSLVATVAILREAGILLGEPDAGLTYEMLTVLRDTQLYQRPSGLDVQLAFGEGYLARPDMMPTPSETGRVEQLLASATYGQQIADDKAEVSGTAFARLRLFAPDDQPSPFALGGTARLRRFAYHQHGDPLGALDVSATLLLSKDSCPVNNAMCGAVLASRIEGEVGFSLFMNQASALRISGQVAATGGELFFGGALTATYGLLDGTFAGL